MRTDTTETVCSAKASIKIAEVKPTEIEDGIAELLLTKLEVGIAERILTDLKVGIAEL